MAFESLTFWTGWVSFHFVLLQYDLLFCRDIHVFAVEITSGQIIFPTHLCLDPALYDVFSICAAHIFKPVVLEEETQTPRS